ncbi:hypothetical protein BZA77DRAFT_307564 [Pyronema omphalodes]|nr:hypothetical protein BZA77DRAFT_307564 [Pyronema omphalodes]
MYQMLIPILILIGFGLSWFRSLAAVVNWFHGSMVLWKYVYIISTFFFLRNLKIEQIHGLKNWG